MSKPVISHHDSAHGTTRSYITGFILSLILTLTAYLVVTEQIFDGWGLVSALAILAITQLMVQLIFFLHLGRQSKPWWNLQAAIFAGGVVIIVVFGSIWIMKNLEYNHGHDRTPSETEEFLIKDEGYKP